MSNPPVPTIPPSSFDTLPELTLLLTRLKPPVPGSINSPAPVTGTTPLPTSTTLPDGSTSLSLKEFPAATDPLKHALQRARQQMRDLPDIRRSVEDQEREIEKLEARKRRQMEELAALRGTGVRLAREDGEDGKKAGGTEDPKGEAREMVMR